MGDLFLALLGDLGVVRTFNTNDIVHLDQIPPESVFVILEGKVKHIICDEHGEEKTLLLLKKGDIFGEVTFFQQDSNMVLTKAISACKITSIGAQEFGRMLERHPELYSEIVKLLTYKMRIIISQVKDMAFQTVEGKLANLILRLADQHGIQTESGHVLIDLDITHQELANMVAAYRSTVSKIMKRITKHRLIEIENRKIVVLDYLGLQQIARADSVKQAEG
jgi:CRP/FNR family transcriptional regulator